MPEPRKSVHDVSVEELIAGNADIQALLRERVPATFKELSWEFWATAMLARSGAILDSVVALVEAGHRADGEVALRTLYLQVLTFCWVAIDPGDHLDLWQQGSEDQWKKFSTEATVDFGLAMPEGQTPDDFAGQKMKVIEQMANDVDREWPKKVPAFRAHPRNGKKDLLTFRGLYLSLFRTTSRIAHAEVDSLQSNVRVRPNYLVVSWSEPGRFGRSWLGLPMLAYAILVYDHHFDWPGQPRAGDLQNALLYEPTKDGEVAGTQGP